mmetsp:Transcript_32715/g.114955  ORF Transcript_32715/g.114955 Transcript_32715/m.114955 type:complete len:527 (-) Transcript_32715:51-1631(-)
MQSVDQFRPKAPGGPRGNMKWQAPGMTSVGGPSSFPGPGGAPQMRPGGAAPGGYPSAGGPGGATGGPGGTFAPRAYASGLPPPQYVCHRCGKGGHFIRECPENGNIDFDKPRVRHGVPGVPRTLWQVIGDDDEVEDGKTLARGPDGQTIVIQPSGVQFDRLVRRNAAQHQTREALAAAAHDAPRHFLCPMCAKVIDDAVLVPCCFESLCDSCARDSLRQSGGRCPLCSKAAAEDKLVPNKSLRAGVQTFLQQWAANTKAKLEDERDAQLLDRADEAPMSLNPLMHNKAPDAVLELRRAAAADDDDATFEVFVSRDGPLGVTMNKEAGGGRATMERVAPGGLAAAAGVKAGDLVLRVGDAATPSYDDALRAVRGADAGRPLRLLLRRGAAKLTPTAATLRFVVSAHEGSFRTRATNSFRDGDDGANEDEDDAWASRHALPEARPDDLEFDCDFDAGPLGMRIEERVGLVSVTVVTDVAAGGQAHRLGVKVGCTLLGFNGERYLSHAHAAAVLQHGKRPVAVRLRFAD